MKTYVGVEVRFKGKLLSIIESRNTYKSLLHESKLTKESYHSSGLGYCGWHCVQKGGFLKQRATVIRLPFTDILE
jgi:hypothetical protein